MASYTDLSGKRYRVLNGALLREKSQRLNDERHHFYVAMLNTNSYDKYLAQVGQRQIMRDGYKANPITGRGEILYCRRNHWIEDV